MIYDVSAMLSAQRKAVGFVEQQDAAAAPPSLTYNIMSMLNIAAPIFQAHDNDKCGTTMVIHRVERMRSDDSATIELMRAQACVPQEVDAFLAQGGTKLVLWGRYVPVGAPHVLRKDTFADDLVIGPDVGLTREQVVEWYFAANFCKSRTCGLKLLLDSLMARGDTMILDDWFPGLTTEHVLTKVTRLAMQASLPLQAFYLVDPALQPEYGHLRHDGAFPVYHQGIGTDDHILHDVLAFTGRPRSGTGPDVLVYADPTYRQIKPCADIPNELKVFPIGGPLGIDPAYIAHGTRALLLDDAPFSADRMADVLKAMFPDGHASREEAQSEGGEAILMLMPALREAMALRFA